MGCVHYRPERARTAERDAASARTVGEKEVAALTLELSAARVGHTQHCNTRNIPQPTTLNSEPKTLDPGHQTLNSEP